MEEKITTDNVEVCTIRADTKRVEYKSKEFIEGMLAQLS